MPLNVANWAFNRCKRKSNFLKTRDKWFSNNYKVFKFILIKKNKNGIISIEKSQLLRWTESRMKDVLNVTADTERLPFW